MFKLTSSHPTREAEALYEYMQKNYGVKMIAAAQECPGRRHDLEVDFLKQETGALPAMRGLDFIHDDYDGVTERAIAWSKLGGIVTICWHTGVIENTYPASQSELPDFDKILTPGSPENTLMLSRWERAANALYRLKEAGIPVLWRPFHEFDGQWFWWGKGDPEFFKELWKTMHKKFTGEYGLDNLIWVLGYSGAVKPGWYPGDGFVDVAGSDNYDATTNFSAYKKLLEITRKPLAFHEVGKIPDIDEFFREGCVWSWFMTWHTRYLIEDNGPEAMKKIYADPRVVTMERLK